MGDDRSVARLSGSAVSMCENQACLTWHLSNSLCLGSEKCNLVESIQAYSRYIPGSTHTPSAPGLWPGSQMELGGGTGGIVLDAFGAFGAMDAPIVWTKNVEVLLSHSRMVGIDYAAA